MATLLAEAPPALLAQLSAYDDLHAPAHLDVEILSSLRGLLLAGLMTPERFADLSLRIEALPILRHPLGPLLGRATALAYNVTPYDAVYISLAESLGIDLLTRDARLARADAPTCPVIVL